MGDMLAREAGVWLWVIDPVTRALTVYGDLTPLLGRNFERLDDLVPLMHPDDVGPVMEKLSASMADGGAGKLECRLRGADGNWIQFCATFRAEPHPSGRHLLCGIARDVTLLAETRAALEEAHRLATLAERLAGVGYWRIEEGSTQFAWSEQMYRIYGRDPALGPLDAKGVMDCCHPDDRDKVRRNQEISVGKEAPDLAVRILRPDGEIRHVIARSMVERDASGKIVARFGTLSDVTDIKRAEAAAKESEQRYRFLADSAPDMITRTSLEGETLYVSPSSVRVFGYTPEEHRHLKAPDMVHPDDRDWVIGEILKLIENRWQRLPEPLCYRARHKNGHWIWVEANPTLIFSDDGEPVEFVDVVRDVTQTKVFEAELKEARSRAEAAAAAKSAFLANMSHELRTPLTSIIGFSRLIGERQDLPEQARRYVKRISEASEALLAIINQVLDFSKLEAGQATLDMRPVSLQRLVDEATGLIAIQAASKGLQVKIDLDPRTPQEITGDVARLRQVLLNFLSNAVKFTDQGSITVKTAYRTDVKRPLLKVSVIDTGTGIAPEAVGRLFERFSQAEVSRNRAHGGTGLGLAISKGVITLMGGRIGVETKLGEGSCFWFEIPAAAATRQAAAKTESAAGLEGLRLRLLIVDDTAINRELVKLMLEPFGFTVEEAGGGAEAVQASMLKPFDLILMDVRMPRVDGLEATRLIRSTSELNRTTPILAVTADVEPDNAAACRAAGMNDMIAKPILLDQLVAKVAQWGARNTEEGLPAAAGPPIAKLAGQAEPWPAPQAGEGGAGESGEANHTLHRQAKRP